MDMNFQGVLPVMNLQKDLLLGLVIQKGGNSDSMIYREYTKCELYDGYQECNDGCEFISGAGCWPV